MKPFRLNAVLSYRQRLEDSAKNKLQAAKKERDEMLENIRQQEDFLRATVEEKEKRSREGCAVLELIQIEEQLVFTGQKLKDLKTILLNKEAAVAREHKNLLKRSKEKKILEKLKEKQDSDWIKYLSKKETAMLDEIAVLRHNK